MAWVGIDFDHTIVNNLDFAPGEQRYANPFPNAKESLVKFKEMGWRVIIHSCNRKAWIQEWMEHWDIPYDLIWSEQGKPICDAYIDDLAVPFRGDWNETFEETLKLVE